MKYLLDFDGVIFNTAALKKKMVEQGFTESSRTAETFTELQRTDPTFDLSGLVFTDAREFLSKHAGDCYIVSSYVSRFVSHADNAQEHRAYQEAKIRLSGVSDMVGDTHVHVVGSSKAEKLQELKDFFGHQNEECIFVDDRKEHIHEAEALGIQAYWMNKSGQKNDLESEGIKEVTNEISTFSDLELKN